MQTPEYQYNTMCSTLEHCPEKCFCYHSWKLGDVIVANCSHGDVQALPVVLPDQTSYLDMSGNNLQKICTAHTYFKNIQVLDLSSN